MSELFATGQAIELVLVLMLIEGAVLVVWQRRSSVHMDLPGLLINLMSGVFLVCAVHSALVGHWWGVIAMYLLGSLVMHCADMWRRLREYARAQSTAKLSGKRVDLIPARGS
ncbi:MAG: hypothetical protein RL341_1015 [Pseudomonadota bacterium]|jgi:hypothetical protein